MPDWLGALTKNRDAKNARRNKLTGEPVLLTSTPSAVLICLVCRKTPSPDWPNFFECPDCSGRLVEIVR